MDFSVHAGVCSILTSRFEAAIEFAQEAENSATLMKMNGSLEIALRTQAVAACHIGSSEVLLRVRDRVKTLPEPLQNRLPGAFDLLMTLGLQLRPAMSERDFKAVGRICSSIAAIDDRLGDLCGFRGTAFWLPIAVHLYEVFAIALRARKNVDARTVDRLKILVEKASQSATFLAGARGGFPLWIHDMGRGLSALCDGRDQEAADCFVRARDVVKWASAESGSESESGHSTADLSSESDLDDMRGEVGNPEMCPHLEARARLHLAEVRRDAAEMRSVKRMFRSLGCKPAEVEARHLAKQFARIHNSSREAIVEPTLQRGSEPTEALSTQKTEVELWISESSISPGLAQRLRDNGFSTLSQLRVLTDDEVAELGVTLLGDRASFRLLRASSNDAGGNDDADNAPAKDTSTTPSFAVVAGVAALVGCAVTGFVVYALSTRRRRTRR
jgi:hypothetical protein